jgi:hypothetical protein
MKRRTSRGTVDIPEGVAWMFWILIIIAVVVALIGK